MADIKFLHLTDLHLGDKLQNGLLSQAKKVLFEDIEHLIKKIGGLDIVFFSGDFVQKGSKEEFQMFEAFLLELWELFKKHNVDPSLFHVPGNHDLERINDSNHPVQKVMLNWTSDSIKNEYFWVKSNDYHKFIEERFKNYRDWSESTSIPTTITKKGYLTGDFYTSMEIKGVKVGILGLNSTFLQLSAGDFRKKLGIYNQQINHLFKDDYFTWIDSCDIVILMTHQSPEWYEDVATSNYLQEIYAQNAFAEHLCGHMHIPSSEDTSQNGYPSRHVFTSPSLFGLEYYEEKGKVDRIHGYTAGIYHVENKSISKTIWPRISLQTKFGLKIVPNEEFNLEKENASMTVILKDNKNTSNGDIGLVIEKLENDGRDLFSKSKPVDRGLNRTFFKDSEHHRSVRKIERDICTDYLNSKRICWITTGFGLAEHEFIGSILKDSNINFNNCFSIDCDDVKSIEELTEKFRSTFSKKHYAIFRHS